MRNTDPDFPLVYSCSGCSSAAQLANHVAVQLDRRGMAEMSCIAGVGGDVPSLVRTAQLGRPVVVLDGCALACAKNCLARHGIAPTQYHQLQLYGVKKRYHADFDPARAEEVIAEVSKEMRRSRRKGEKPAPRPPYRNSNCKPSGHLLHPRRSVKLSNRAVTSDTTS